MTNQTELDFGNEQFWSFHRKNPQVYEMLKKIIFDAIGKGYKHFSIDMAYQICRWNSKIKTDDKEFKVNDKYRSYYGRLFVLEYPEHKSLFSFRKSKANSILETKK